MCFPIRAFEFGFSVFFRYYVCGTSVGAIHFRAAPLVFWVWTSARKGKGGRDLRLGLVEVMVVGACGRRYDMVLGD